MRNLWNGKGRWGEYKGGRQHFCSRWNQTGNRNSDICRRLEKQVDRKTGKYRLSRKALLEKPEGYVEREPRERPERNDRDRGNDRNRNDRRPR